MAKKIKLVTLKDITTYRQKLAFYTCPVCRKEYTLKSGRVNYCPWGCDISVQDNKLTCVVHPTETCNCELKITC